MATNITLTNIRRGRQDNKNFAEATLDFDDAGATYVAGGIPLWDDSAGANAAFTVTIGTDVHDNLMAALGFRTITEAFIRASTTSEYTEAQWQAGVDDGTNGPTISYFVDCDNPLQPTLKAFEANAEKTGAMDQDQNVRIRFVGK